MAGFLSPTSGDALLSKGGDEEKIKGPGEDRVVVYSEGYEKVSADDFRPIVGPGKDRGVVFQRHALLPWLNVIDNTSFGLKLSGVAKRSAISGRGNFGLVGLSEFYYHKIYQLSGGNAAARWYCPRFDLRPGNVVDGRTVRRIRRLDARKSPRITVGCVARDAKMIFFITHSVEEALFLATRLVVMSPRRGALRTPFNLDFAGNSWRRKNATPERLNHCRRLLTCVRKFSISFTPMKKRALKRRSGNHVEDVADMIFGGKQKYVETYGAPGQGSSTHASIISVVFWRFCGC